MRDISDLHTFVICAYNECGYLEELIESLEGQTVRSTVIMETSTPNDFIYDMGKKHGIPVFVNKNPAGITDDWNFGYSMAKTEYVTIAHQDDRYAPDYARHMIEAMENAKHPLIYFTDYNEIRGTRIVTENKLLKIKRFMLRALEDRKNADNIKCRRRILSFGDPILCPSITYARSNVPEVLFQNHFMACGDWEALEMLSKLEGEFIYDKNVLIFHRIHDGSSTSLAFRQNIRFEEDYEMFRKFWSERAARILVRLYSNSRKSNELTEAW